MCLCYWLYIVELIDGMAAVCHSEVWGFNEIEYYVSAVVNETELLVEVEDRLTADQWCNTFTASSQCHHSY